MRGSVAFLAAALLVAAVPVQAQQDATSVAAAQATTSPESDVAIAGAAILTVDQEVLWRGSAWGRRAQAELEAEGAAMAAENDRIAAALEAEDAALTELRKTLSPADFRARADAFDERVQTVRRDRDAAAVALRAKVGEERTAFLNASLPVFSEIMAERRAVVVLDRDSVFLSADSIDVTSELITRVDAQVGAGPAPDAATPPDDAEPKQAP